MLGWMIVFALLALTAATLTMIAGPAAALLSTKAAVLLFGGLFLIGAVTNLARGRA
jgi:uncharacterized membrane protein YtjA (UPF0391 family)